jgi:hypothetical protein
MKKAEICRGTGGVSAGPATQSGSKEAKLKLTAVEAK